MILFYYDEICYDVICKVFEKGFLKVFCDVVLRWGRVFKRGEKNVNFLKFESEFGFFEYSNGDVLWRNDNC